MIDSKSMPLVGPQNAVAKVALPARPPVLDAAALAGLRQLDPTGVNQLMQRVLTTYRSSLTRLLGQLATARQQTDTASLRLVTHTLKSSSASIGALTLSALCGAAEQAVRDGRLGELPPLLDQLEAEAADVDAAVLQLLQDQ
jgi:HPt (histidine-containing phosphotransfer) domain-containing protein